jgi:hypothetical protein
MNEHDVRVVYSCSWTRNLKIYFTGSAFRLYVIKQDTGTPQVYYERMNGSLTRDVVSLG